MNTSVLCLLLVVVVGSTLAMVTAPAPTTTMGKTTAHVTDQGPTTAPKTTGQPTTAPNTTHSQPTTAPNTTHSQPTTAPNTTHSQPTTAPNTTHSQPTTAPNTTHSQPTTAPNTTHSQPTTAPNTTHSQPTTAPNTTHNQPTTAPNTTHSQPTTAAAGNTTYNATGSTVGTTPAHTTVSRPENVIPSYQVKNNDSEVCMLFVFNATLKIKYETTNNKTGVATIPIGGKINGKNTEWVYDGICGNDPMRVFLIHASYAVPNSNATGQVTITQFYFVSSDKPTYSLGLLTAGWSYYEPFFPRDVKNYGESKWEEYPNVYTGTIGNTFGCQTLNLSSDENSLTIFMDHVMLQPYADSANGTFGDVEECNLNPTTTNPLTANATTMKPATAHATTMKPATANATTAFPHHKPSPDHGGMIAGIVIGVLALIVIVVGIAVFVVRKRRLKEVAYGHMEGDHKDYVH